MEGMRVLPAIALLGLLSAGCVTTQARSEVGHVPLDVPPVPPRVIVPEIEEVAPPAAAVTDPASAARPSAQRADPPARAADKPPDPPRTGTPDPPRNTEEAPRVRTPQTANDEQAEREVRSVMARAQGTLNNVHYQSLSGAARQQYDTARRFLAQADSALKIRNYVFARNLADKAETLARQLGK
jgi:hypothetical protein